MDKRKTNPGNPTGKGGFKENPQNINSGGFTSEQKALHKENRDKALAIESRMLDAVTNTLGENEREIVDSIRGDVLRLIHVAIERYDGKAKQAVDIESPRGTMSPKEVSPEVAATLASKLTE